MYKYRTWKKKKKNWAHKISCWEYLTIWRPALPVFLKHRVLHFRSPPWAPSGVVKDQQPPIWSNSSTGSNPSRGGWQAPMASAICSWQHHRQSAVSAIWKIKISKENSEKCLSEAISSLIGNLVWTGTTDAETQPYRQPLLLALARSPSKFRTVGNGHSSSRTTLVSVWAQETYSI